jgi:predicted phage terminase large subunit-like protein
VNRKTLNAILRSDFHSFATKSFELLNPGVSLDKNWHLEAISSALERVRKREITRLIINAPPRSLKSFLTSVALPAFLLGRDPTRRFICASYSQDLASKLSSDCRRLIESDVYRELFPNLILEKSTESELQTNRGGFRYATSVGGTMTGRGGDDLIVDDPLNANETYSEVSRKAAIEWFSGSLISRLDRKLDGAIIVVAQRLHPEDLSGHLLEQGGWEHLCLPAVGQRNISVPLLRANHLWKAGEPLQEVREPKPVLDRLKAELGSAMFSAQYLQEPIPEGGNMLNPEWLGEYAFAPARQRGDKIVQSWDTAIKATDGSDYSVCLTFHVLKDNRYYLLDVLRKKLEFPDLLNEVREGAKNFRPDAMLIEDKGSGTQLIQYAKRLGLSGVIGVTPEKDKRTRMYGQTPKLESKSLFLPRSAPWLSEFRKEYLAFPAGRHDDQIDALSQFLIWQSQKESSTFECDWGRSDVGAPHPDDILRFLRRS